MYRIDYTLPSGETGSITDASRQVVMQLARIEKLAQPGIVIVGPYKIPYQEGKE